MYGAVEFLARCVVAPEIVPASKGTNRCRRNCHHVTMLAGTLDVPKRQEAECLPLSRPPASMLEAASNSLPNL